MNGLNDGRVQGYRCLCDNGGNHDNLIAKSPQRFYPDGAPSSELSAQLTTADRTVTLNID